MTAPLLLTAKRFERILDAHPDLTGHGFGTYRSPSDTAEQRRRRFEADRATLAGEHGAVAAIAAWLQAHIAPIKMPGPHAYSYALKHVAEDYFGGYVSNGELIAAALVAGYPMRRLGLVVVGEQFIGNR
ncbi:hypothetical protein [Mycolicibacter kumamotonensis]|uniref:Uncharacterized protein n=1 Tax=Mycolicibacter kumamotonensis TaxID=354243 RepID=A0A7K3LGK4_9MYCO|nr:hypothetical protein [Mycolicibacter kumamotonensis]NDJ91468.1 hypothetical protein [Mycolicibacter kumamotonensis]